jgi:hypothetical protein
MNTQETLLKSGKSLPVLKPGKKLKQQEKKSKAEQESASYKEEFDKAWAKGLSLEESIKQQHQWIENWKLEHPGWENSPNVCHFNSTEEAEEAFDRYFASEEYLQHAREVEERIWGKRSADYKEEFDKNWAEGISAEEFRQRMHKRIDAWSWENR